MHKTSIFSINWKLCNWI